MSASSPAILVDRLRKLVGEIESAHRYGVPIPAVVSVNGYPNMGASFSATPEEFDAWVDYCIEATVEEYDHDGKHWRRAVDDVNGLRLEFATIDERVTA